MAPMGEAPHGGHEQTASRPAGKHSAAPEHSAAGEPPVTLPVPVSSARRLRPTAAGNPALDRLAALAARLLATSAAQVALLTDVQTIAAGVGLPPGSVGADSPLAESLCTVTADGGLE